MQNFLKVCSKVPRIAWWLSGALLLYTLLGFLLVPWLAERQLQGLLQQRLALSAQVEKIYFNPFTLYARVDGLNVVENDGAPLLRLETLHANFQPTRLLLLRLQFAELAVQDLDFYFQRDAQGLDTLSRLAQAWSATAPVSESPPEPEAGEAEGGPVPLLVEAVNLDNLNLHVRDAVPATPFETTLTLASARIVDLSTLRDRVGTDVLSLAFEDQAQLDWSGQLQLNPPLFTGKVALENFALGTVSRYLQDTLPLTVDSGRVNAALAYRVDLSGESLSVELEQMELSVSDLAASQDGVDQPFATAARLQASNGSLVIPDNRVALETLQLEQFELAVSRETDAETNLQQMIAAFTAVGSGDPDTAAAEQADAGSPWEVSLQRLVLAGNRITFDDRNLEAPASLGVGLDLEIRDLDNQPESEFPLTATLAMDSGGELQVEGSLGVLPALNLTSNVTLQALDLTVLQPYVNEFAYVRLDSGLLDMQSEWLVDADQPFAYRGDVILRELDVSDQNLQEDLLSLASLSVDGIDFSLADSRLDISEIVIDAPFVRVLINEAASTNVGQLVRQSDSTVAEPVADTAAADVDGADATETGLPLAITIGRIQVNEAASDFTDLNLPIPFHADIQELSGAAEGFSAPSSQPIELALEGNVDEFGLVQLDSSFNPFAITEQSSIDLEFRNLEVPTLTPYTVKFAGREIADGSMDVDLSYQLDAGQLVATNQVVLRDLRLGERVEYPGAMDLPLDLAVALLKDGNGVIDLEVPVSGDVNSPEFDIGPVIRRAITNVLTSIVAAPFRLLGALIGGAGDDISALKFQVGRSDLAPPERQALEQLSEALVQRPELVLEIPLLATEADRQALQTSLVVARVNAAIEQLPDAEGSLTQRRLAVLETLYNEAGLSPSPEEIQALNNIETSVQNPLTGESLVTQQLDVQAYSNDLRGRLVAIEPVSDRQLEELAEARVAAVREYLLAQGALSEAQLAVAGPQDGEPDDDGWLTMEFGLGSGSR